MSSEVTTHKLILSDIIWFVFAHLRLEEKPAFAFVLNHRLLHTFFFVLKEEYKKSGYSGRVREAFKPVIFDIHGAFPFSNGLDEAIGGVRLAMNVNCHLSNWQEGEGQAVVIGRHNDQSFRRDYTLGGEPFSKPELKVLQNIVARLRESMVETAKKRDIQPWLDNIEASVSN